MYNHGSYQKILMVDLIIDGHVLLSDSGDTNYVCRSSDLTLPLSGKTVASVIANSIGVHPTSQPVSCSWSIYGVSTTIDHTFLMSSYYPVNLFGHDITIKCSMMILCLPDGFLAQFMRSSDPSRPPMTTVSFELISPLHVY